jgi:hypothetical protein
MNAILVNLKISNWQARKYDKKVSSQAEDAFSAKDAGRYNKKLIAKDLLKGIQQSISEARSIHYEQSLPFSDDGRRLLPTANYFDYVSSMKKCVDQFEDEVEKFVTQYPSYIGMAKRRLGEMFVYSDYPDASEIRGKYGITLSYEPMSDPSKADIDIDDSSADVIRQQGMDLQKERMEKSMSDLSSRLMTSVEKLYDALRSGKGFKNSIIGNIKSICKLAPKLDMSEDGHVGQAADEILSKLGIYEPSILRRDGDTRNDAAADAQSILDKFGGIL